ncbi:hypothetical protein EON63_20345 [archaeon]|nr:MAG: hypothetical protein EON63_20345 [archaeon]
MYPDTLPLLCIYTSNPSVLLLVRECLRENIKIFFSGAAASDTFPLALFPVLNMADMYVRSVVTVTSLEDCHYLT